MRILMLVALLFSSSALTHGLEMTTAKVTLRGQNHLTIRIETDLGKFSGRIDWPGKPKTLMHMATANEQQVMAFRQALITLFAKEMSVTIGGEPMQSQQARLPDHKRLTKQLQTAAAEQLMPKDHSHDYDQRHNYLVINIDGFIPKSAKSRALNIDFPAALGAITVSYSKPQMQTLSAGEKTTAYRQLLD